MAKSRCVYMDKNGNIYIIKADKTTSKTANLIEEAYRHTINERKREEKDRG